MTQYVIDYDVCDVVPYAINILQEWYGWITSKKKDLAKNRFQVRYDEVYKGSLEADLLGTLTPGTNVHYQVEDTKCKSQVQMFNFQQQWEEREHEYQCEREQNYKSLVHMAQELANARECVVKLDKDMERQLASL